MTIHLKWMALKAWERDAYWLIFLSGILSMAMPCIDVLLCMYVCGHWMLVCGGICKMLLTYLGAVVIFLKVFDWNVSVLC